MPTNLRVHNTLTRTIEPLRPAVPGRVGLYVCGMTVYDYCHIGHARAMMAFDVVVRYLRHAGHDVLFVRNHTDVDDKIIRRAKEKGVPPLALSAEFIGALEQDLADMGLVAPSVTPSVSHHIPEILDIIGRLVSRGHAYQAENGDVYFAVETFGRYGQLSGKKLDDLRAGERVAVEAAKRHPADFALWKAWTGEESEPRWESPWGPGRPGWHIECSAMARAHLGDTFDLHGGGIDLIFPHHENEIAQTECALGVHPMCRVWMHNGHLTLGTEKMSKSLGNIVRIRDALAEAPAEALRLLYLDTHYRSPLPYSDAKLTNALAALDRLYCAKEVAVGAADAESADPSSLGEAGREVYRLGQAFTERFGAAMDEDFNSAAAVGHLFELVRAVNRFGNDKKARARGRAALAPAAAAFQLVGDVLGVGAMAPGAFFEEVKTKRLATQGRSAADVEGKLQARAEARNRKDWAEADRIRGELDAEGIVVMDHPGGSTWRMRVAEVAEVAEES